jgi:hemolysin activation/secretion protein
MAMRSVASLILMGVLLLACLVSAHAQQAGPVDPGRQLLEEQRRDLLQRRLERSRPGLNLDEQKTVAPVEDRLCFPIERIRLEGVSALDQDSLSMLIAPYANRCMGQGAIEALIKSVTNAYLARGYITTRVYVPAQDLRSKILRLDVVEGRIERLDYTRIGADGQPEPGPARTPFMAFPTTDGTVLQLRDLEQGLDQINRLASSQATIDIKPGEKPGHSIVVVSHKQENRLRLRLGLDNFGTRAAGQQRYRGVFEWDDALGLADALSVSLQTSRASNALSGSFSLPFGYWTATASASFSENAQLLNPVSELFSRTASLSLKVDRLIYRDADTKMRLAVLASNNFNARFINGTALTPQRRGALRFSAEFEKRLGANVFFVDIGLWQGAPWLGGDEVKPPSGSLAPHSAFTKYDATLIWSRLLTQDWRMNASLNLQYAHKPLFSPDQASLGGFETIRGVRDPLLSGENAAIGRLELSGLIPATLVPDRLGEPWRQAIRPYAFVEGGRLRNIAQAQSRAAGSAGFGARLSYERLSGEVGIAFPFGQASLPGTKRDPFQIYAALNVKVF